MALGNIATLLVILGILAGIGMFSASLIIGIAQKIFGPLKKPIKIALGVISFAAPISLIFIEAANFSR